MAQFPSHQDKLVETRMIKFVSTRFVLWISLAVTAYIAYCVIFYGAVEYFFPNNLSANVTNIEHVGMLEIFLTMVLAPISEESLFRLLPFWAVMGHFAFTRHHNTAFYITTFVTSCLFGLIHGGVGNIFVQGFMGVISCLTFRYWSQDFIYLGRGYLASVVLHSAVNGTILTIFSFI